MATSKTADQTRTRDQMVPKDLEAERSILGSIMINSSLFNQAAEVLKPEDFHLESHRIIFRSFFNISERSERGSGAIDLVTMRAAIEKTATLEDVGGNAYITSLIDGLPRLSNLRNYINIVKEKSVLRSLINAGTTIVNDSYADREEASTILENAQSLIFKIADGSYSTSGFRNVSDLVSETVEKLASMVDAQSGITGLATGFADFDRITSGLHEGDLIIIAARPGMGKTSFALNIALNAANAGHKVGLFSLEMDIQQLFIRLLCSEARVNSQKIRNGRISSQDYEKLGEQLDAMTGLSLFIDDTPNLGVMQVRSKARRLKAEYGLELLVIDYLQLMETSRNVENRNLAIGEITRGLKNLAKELKLPIILLSQLSRAVENRTDKRPQLSDLRESGNIEQDADLVSFLYRPEYYEKEKTEKNKGLAELKIAKNRNGPVGTVNLVFFADYTRFQDHTPVDVEEQL